MSSRLNFGDLGKIFLLSKDDENFKNICLNAFNDNEMFYKILEGISDIFYVLDSKWQFVYLNHAAERYFGVRRQEIIGKCIWNIFPQAVKSMLHENLCLAKSNSQQIKFEEPSFFGASGCQKYTIYPTEEYVSIILNDRTQHKEKLELSDEFMMRVFNAGHSMMAIKTMNGRMIDANKSWLTGTGYCKEEVIGKLEEEINIWVSLETREIINNLRPDGAIYNFEVEFKTKEGNNRTGLLSIEEIEVGSMKCYLEAITDITKQKELEREMAKLDRLNTIGQMAAGISHEFRNPITTIRGFIQMLSGRNELENIRDYFDIMLEEIDRANSIITEFLTLSKNKSLNLRKNNINICINKLFPMIQAGALNEDKDVQLELADVADIFMDEDEIRQLILNISRNAIEASPTYGVVIIKTYQSGDEVLLEIKDQGKGIAPEVLGKIGTPFFTTKVDGTGMGLVVCHRIAERHNANIIINTGDMGTTFLIKFKAF